MTKSHQFLSSTLSQVPSTLFHGPLAPLGSLKCLFPFILQCWRVRHPFEKIRTISRHDFFCSGHYKNFDITDTCNEIVHIQWLIMICTTWDYSLYSHFHPHCSWLKEQAWRQSEYQTGHPQHAELLTSIIFWWYQRYLTASVFLFKRNLQEGLLDVWYKGNVM